MAEKGRVSIGGWLVAESGCTRDSMWFHLEVSEDTLPVVYQKGKTQAFRYIATLELLGTLCGMQAFVWNSERHDQSAEATCCAITDNLGNQFAWRKQLSTKYPMCCVLMELAMGMALRGGEMELLWRPREENQHADDLSKRKFENFDMAKKVEINLE
eukprot:12420329-Karenia_brevis.AAC.1